MGWTLKTVAATSPDLIVKEPIVGRGGPTEEQLGRMADVLRLNRTPMIKKQAMEQMRNLYQMFVAVDATQVEVNPLGLTPEGEVICFDAKINFDDNAAYRQRSIYEKSATTEDGLDAREQAAQAQNLNYIGLDGSVGCLVNGAGLAMATMDLLSLHGGRPANFLDVGGGATAKQIAAAFKLLLTDSQVQSILVNIFGGIVKCDLIAEGILMASKDGIEVGRRIVPLVIRLAGTNEEIAKQRLRAEYPAPLAIVDDLEAAAQMAIQYNHSHKSVKDQTAIKAAPSYCIQN